MPRSRHPQGAVEPAPARRGRPPLPPRTHFARWIQTSGGTIVQFADRMAELAISNGIPADEVPNAKTLTNVANLRHPPSATTMLLVRILTDGAIDLDQWVEDALSIRKPPRG